ncbi:MULTISPECIES: hypothetical protein [Rhodococcus]|uniref:Uncharacterized protein n=1 Tax=Rhodococcus opacus RKJ300 = JCM 13270 TaxID=1165867 RepID=I0WEE7_RHOOP|nr:MULTISPECIES: hypothetical protein [Rhodococcus]EID74763.1 hypothetical protein W59_28555 [Rhodococcus opacus RKJ300 = JCM 13270]QQZ12333.1 hypothetical protein GO592_21275 [Rhodococcus sp. 21391]
MENGISTNGSGSNGSAGTNSASESPFAEPSTGGLTGSNGNGNGKSTTSSAEKFTFPLPTRSSGSHSTEEPAEASDTTASLESRGRTVMRRNAMGVAAVRVAGRLAHTELLEEHLASASSHSADPTVDADELLALLGEYLVAAGFERPEIHAKLNGQSIVVDLRSPSATAR